MNDYSATTSEPILQGLITIDPVTVLPVFSGKGVSAIVRTVGGAAAGDYTLTLDSGLPGNVGLDPTFGRYVATVRGSSAAVVVGSTSIDEKALTYVPSAVPGVGSNHLRLVLTAAGVATDPFDADGDGCELIVWRADVPLFQQTIVGPLYQPVIFP